MLAVGELAEESFLDFKLPLRDEGCFADSSSSVSSLTSAPRLR